MHGSGCCWFVVAGDVDIGPIVTMLLLLVIGCAVSVNVGVVVGVCIVCGDAFIDPGVVGVIVDVSFSVAFQCSCWRCF